MSRLHRLPWRALLALCAGALLPLSLAPFHVWPLGPLSVAALAALLYGSDGRAAFWRSWSYGLGLFGAGASWVFVSIHQFGNAPTIVAVLLTGAFILLLASLFALPLWALGRYFARGWSFALAFPALWVLGEWLRSWLFTGFPWLYLGYGQLDTWLAGWAPVAGVMGMSLLVALTGLALVFPWLDGRFRWPRLLPLGAALLLWGAGAPLNQVEWTRPAGDAVDVGIVQGNIPQEKKWDPSFLQPTIERYTRMTRELWANDWVIWPEAALPMLYHQAEPIMDELRQEALENDSALISGVLYDSQSRRAYYNSIIALGLGSGIYHKQRLVPFGDYVPLRDWFGPLLSILDLPMSILQPGPDEQQGLQVGENRIAPSVCYEVAYPDAVMETAQNTEVLITVSNDAWFGASIGPLQHMQIARARALESGRYLIRATNNGVSAIVDHRGRILERSEQFVQQNLEGQIQPRQGNTPFMRSGSEALAVFCLLMLGAAWGAGRLRSRS